MGVVSTWSLRRERGKAPDSTSPAAPTGLPSMRGSARELSRTLGDVTFANQFDSLGRLTDQRVTSATATIQHRTYTYRADGNLTGMDDHRNGARHFELDTAGRVTTVSAPHWAETYSLRRGRKPDPRHLARPPPRARGPGRAHLHRHPAEPSRGGVRYAYDAAGRTILRQKTVSLVSLTPGATPGTRKTG